MVEVAARVTQWSGDSGSRMGKETPTAPSAPQRPKRWRPPLNLHVYHLAWTLSFALRTAPTHQSDARLDPRSPEQVLCSCLCGISQRVCVYMFTSLGGLSGVSQCRCVQWPRLCLCMWIWICGRTCMLVCVCKWPVYCRLDRWALQ